MSVVERERAFGSREEYRAELARGAGTDGRSAAASTRADAAGDAEPAPVDCPEPPAQRTDEPDRRAIRTADLVAMSPVEREGAFGSREDHRAELRDILARRGQDDGRSEARPDRAAELRALVTDNAGRLVGTEGRRKDVRLVSAEQLQDVYEEIQALLGEPDQRVETQKGSFEMWWISTKPRRAVTYRTFSASGDVTIDFSRVEGLDDIKRLHIRQDGDK